MVKLMQTNKPETEVRVQMRHVDPETRRPFGKSFPVYLKQKTLDKIMEAANGNRT